MKVNEQGVIGFQGCDHRYGRGAKNLVIDVRDVHNEVNIITKVIGDNTSKDVLGHIIPGNG